MKKVTLARGREIRVESGHPWIFKSDIEKLTGNISPGDIVDVYSYKNRFLVRGYYNPASQITIRVLSYQDEKIDHDFFFRRIKAAWEHRQKIADPNSCRVVFGESDLVPALIVDKFGDYLVIQSLSLGIEKYKAMLVDILDEIIHPEGIYERNDVTVRTLEGLSQNKGFLKGSFDTTVKMQENGVWFNVDVENGQKTGFFLDQKENRAALKPLVKNARVLDCFSHTGSFALHAGSFGAREVLGIDISEHAVAFASRNAQLNKLEHIVHFSTLNTFDALRDFYDRKESYDVVILDPPAFTKSKSAIAGATRGYKEINLRAMKLIPPGGFLITCSCSYHISPQMFMDILQSCAHDAKRNIRLIEVRTQAKDHPILLAAPETQYLKCVILQMLT